MSILELTKKLSPTLVSIYSDIDQVMNAHGINYVVVGATARDIVLVNCYGASIERGTRDVDFGIYVETWDEFNLVKSSLLKYEFEVDKRHAYRFSRNGNDGLTWEVDILPFGGLEESHEVSWPPSHEILMATYGFSEALKAAWSVKISDELILPVASPEGIVLLKLVAWTERERRYRERDAQDVEYIIYNYSRIPEIVSRLYDEGYMENADYSEHIAAASLIGSVCAGLASAETKGYLRGGLLNSKKKSEEFIREMAKHSKYPDECKQIMAEFKKAFF